MNKAERIAQYQRERLERDRKMVASPDRWPRWPFLPMKLRNGEWFTNAQGTGWLHDDDPIQPVIHFSLLGEDGGKREFATMEDLLAVYTVD
jgi:hypothetical protein